MANANKINKGSSPQITRDRAVHAAKVAALEAEITFYESCIDAGVLPDGAQQDYEKSLREAEVKHLSAKKKAGETAMQSLITSENDDEEVSDTSEIQYEASGF